MARAYIFMADGLEEIEALTVVDILRRAEIEIQMVSVTGARRIVGSHGIALETDILFEEIDAEEAELFVLPGGMPGTKHLASHEGLGRMLLSQAAKGKKIAAICAAPSVLGGLGLLKGRTAVCYPGFEDSLVGAQVKYTPVEVCGNVITSRGMGTALSFALELVAQLCDRNTAERLSAGVMKE